ncbi:MAG: RluA family pseudouridine synthase [Treponema sp.]|jgi:23S rRNA pseudouridine955/2504/2580 synthase|nr:RluA family pseudouridine synthase [Treponema sp.]
MQYKKFIVGINDDDRRIDRIIRNFIPDISLGDIYKSIRKGLIKVNNKKTKNDCHVQKNDEISIADFLLSDITVNKNEIINFDLNSIIVLQTSDLLIINKPYNMLTQGDSKSLDKIVQSYYKNNFTHSSLSFVPGPLHRLDKKTTGLVTFSLSLAGARWFSENIQNHSIKKHYKGIILGKILKTEIWDEYIKTEKDNKSGFHTVKVNSEDENGYKDSYTEVIPLKYGKYKDKDITLVEFRIKTGRMHQIRAVSAFHNHPLLGDTAYGAIEMKDSNQDFFLQAVALLFPKDNPLNLPEKVEIDLSDNFKEFVYKNL